MDPNATWQSILTLMGRAQGKACSCDPEAVDHGGDVCDTCDDRESLVEDMRNLVGWIERGGVLPQV